MTPLLYSTFNVNLPLQPTAPGMPVSSLFFLLLLHHSSSLPTSQRVLQPRTSSHLLFLKHCDLWLMDLFRVVPSVPSLFLPWSLPHLLGTSHLSANCPNPPLNYSFLKKQKECDSMIPLLKSLVWLSIACKVNSSLSGTLPHSLSLTSLSISNEKNFHNSESLDVRFLPPRIFFHLFHLENSCSSLRVLLSC